MKFNISTVITIAGLIGIAVFLYLRSSVDFSGGIPVDPGRHQMQERTAELLSDFEFGGDTLNYISSYRYRSTYLDELNDAHSSYQHPGTLNRQGYPLTGWEVYQLESSSVFSQQINNHNIAHSHSEVSVSFNPDSGVYAIHTNTSLRHDTPLEEWLDVAAADFFTDGLGFNYDNFTIDSVAVDGEASTMANLRIEDEPAEREVELFWLPVESGPGIPEQLELTAIAESDQWYLDSFIASYFPGNDFSSAYMAQPEPHEIIHVIAIFIILGIVILSVGLRSIFKGEVEWYRVFLFLVGLFVLILATHNILNRQYLSVLEEDFWIIDHLNIILNFILMCLIVGLAYLSWDTLARKQHQPQLAVVDHFWQGRFFTRPAGRAILSGYASAGVILGILTLVLYATDGYYILYSYSTLGIMTANSIYAPIGLITGSIAWSIVYMLCTVAIICSLIGSLTGKDLLLVPISTVLITPVFLALGWIFMDIGSASIYTDIIIILVISLATVLLFRYVGLVSLIIASSVAALLAFICSLWGATDLVPFTNIWLLAGALSLPFLFGLIANFKGSTPDEYRDYRPDYEERIARQYRYEREMQIARESQLTLMPDSEPEVEGLDVKGFFIPSLEVGGDYFDYDVLYDRDEATQFNIAVVDVSGKGMQAAITAIFTSGLLLSRLLTDHAHTAMSRVNTILKDKTHAQTFVTCQIAEYQLKSRKLTFTNAGHTRPLLKRGKEVWFLEGSDPRLPLGVRKEVEYSYTEITLEPGDVLLFYSDGLPEARSQSGQFLGYEYIQKLMKWMDTSDISAAEICATIRSKIMELNNQELADDITVVAMKVER